MVSQFGSLGYTIMGKTAELTVVQKTIIDTLHKEGKPQTFIAKEAGCSQSAVSKHVNKVEGKEKVWKKKMHNRENCSPERLVKLNRFKNLGELHKQWTEAGVKASRATTQRRVKEFGYSCCIPLVKSLLNHRQHQRRLTWAEEKKKWTKVLFSDESKFCISFGNQGPRVRRKGGEPHSPSCLKSSVKFSQSLFKDADFIFQQDLAPAHTAKSTKSWLHDHGVGVLDWPANSSDMNPIENLWGTQCHRLITSMPRRIEAVIKAKGAPAKY
ncbi:Transposable element Tc1 transposase [Labeo rohita]|uniref:Transposable element Tc1 transposase n=1 Tax=Labeo rohita TaxID=84645 RepID=A0ABQ8LBX5_LABRO|nr:Transposable element Tc1 transposase [Labeo rohita]